MTHQLDTTPEQTRLVLGGECKLSELPSLMEAFQDALMLTGPAMRLEVGLAEVTLLDAAAAQMLLAALRTAREKGVPMVIAPLSDPARETLTRLAADKMLGLGTVS